MDLLLQGLMVFFAQYFTVLLLGFQSKLMRDNRWMFSTLTSSLITLAQTGTVYAIAHNTLGMPLLLALSCAGGSVGIACAHFAYQWYDNLRGKH